jgi:uncharacterized membrane protein
MNHTEPPRTNSDQRVLAILSTISLVALVVGSGLVQAFKFLEAAMMDVGVYYDASLALRTGGDMFGAFDQAPLTYIYPPFFAIIFMPLTYLSLEWAAFIWTIVNIGLLFGILWFGGRDLLHRFGARLDSATLPVMLLLSCLYFYPRIDGEFDQGQVDFLVLMGVIVGLLLIRRHPVLAGVMLGIVANVKYQTVIFVPYFLLRGWWSAAVGFVSGALAAALSGALVIGWATNLDYLRRAFSGLGSMMGLPPGDGAMPYIFPVEWTESVSLTSTFARWSDAAGFGDGGMVLMVALAALTCLLVGWGIHWRAGAALFKGRFGVTGRTAEALQPLILLEWLGLMVAALAFAPQTKMRHLALLLFLVMAAMMFLVVRRPGVPRVPLMLAMIVYFLALVMPPPVTEELAVLRKSFRAHGAPSWALLVLYFTLLWTGLRWVRTMRFDEVPDRRSAALDESVDQVS